jgi:precorrin-2 dehydrogenase/sirohydrochlorin ferrochelatase
VLLLKIPIFVDVEGMEILIVGGGEEGYKKARRFLQAGGRVTVFSKEFCEDLLNLSKEWPGLRIVHGDAMDQGALEDLIRASDIIVSALNDAWDIDSVIISLARRYRKLYILAGDAGRTQCGLGIEGSSGDIRFAIYTDGRSSLVAMEARDRVAGFLDRQADLHVMLKLLSRMKRILRQSGVPSDLRIEIHRRVFRDPIFRSRAEAGDEGGAWERVVEIVRSMAEIDLRVGLVG